MNVDFVCFLFGFYVCFFKILQSAYQVNITLSPHSNIFKLLIDKMKEVCVKEKTIQKERGIICF